MPQKLTHFELFNAAYIRGGPDRLRLEYLLARRNHDDAVADAGTTLAYYASRLPGKESWVQTDEGYRIYLNVPIARTGFQQYYGREIKKNRGYKPEWNIDDDELVTVYRPIEEVTDPTTLASFEFKSVLDEHPEGSKVLIDALDEYDDYHRGSGGNVRVGPTLPDGETSIIADLCVKHPELNEKIELGVRDISCGYTFLLDKDSAGRYIQRKIRGNHIAVVPKGRAGSDIGIGDAAPPSKLKFRSLKMPVTAKSKTPSLLTKLFIATGFQSWAKDAKPEEIADALDEMHTNGVVDADPDDDKDEDEDKDKKGTKDGKRGAKDADEHPAGCRCKDCMAAKDAESHPEKCKCDDCMGVDDADMEDVDEEAGDKKGTKDKKGAKDDAEILSDEAPESLFSVKDAAADLKSLKMAAASSKDPKAKEAYNRLAKSIRTVQHGVKDGAPDPFLELAKPSNTDAANDSEPETPMFMFFNGKTHAEGLKDWNAYVESRTKK